MNPPQAHLKLFHVNPLQTQTNSQRTLIIGNAGAGKSWLAARIAAGRQVTCLDDIYWQDAISLKKRGQQEAIAQLQHACAPSAWVVEGVFGWLIDVALARATQLIWLDLLVGDCVAGLRERGLTAGTSRAEFDGLIAWSTGYDVRLTSTSKLGHERTFEGFRAAKIKLQSRAAVTTWANLPRS